MIAPVDPYVAHVLASIEAAKDRERQPDPRIPLKPRTIVGLRDEIVARVLRETSRT